MNTAQTIPPKDKPFAPNAPMHLDYAFLREEGLTHIQDLSGQLWTDHNMHDPGITIMEVLCYALTDLAYRAQLPDADIFAPNPKNRTAAEGVDDNFSTAYTLLSCNPLTELDWRKLLLDIAGVRNAWLVPIETKKIQEPTLLDEKQGFLFKKQGKKTVWKNDLWESEAQVFYDNRDIEQLTYEPILLTTGSELRESEGLSYPLSVRGVYKIRLELEPNIADKAPILEEVRRRLAGHRNLCEDFGGIEIVRDEPLTLCAEFELDATAQPDAVLLEIFNRIQAFFSPTIRFYTLREMLDKGHSMENIFEGRPMLPDSHGFIDPEELEKVILPTEIRISDLYHLILGDDPKVKPNGLFKIEGIAAIKKLIVINPATDAAEKGEAWLVKITEGARPTLNVSKSVSSITFFKRGIPYRVNGNQVIEQFEKRLVNPTKIRRNLAEERQKGRQNLDSAVPTGEYRADLGEHVSIQEDFPVVYGIGESGVPASAGKERQAQAAQLKGYLMFYDHLLANYLAQLANIRTLFSAKLTRDGQPLPAGDAANLPWLGLSAEVFEPLAPVADLRQTVPNADSLFAFAKTENTVQIGLPSARKMAFFDIGEVVAASETTYPTPHNRDRALRQLIADVDADVVKIVVKPIKEHIGDLDKYAFQFVSQVSRTVILTSLKLYNSAIEAENRAKTVRFVATLESSYRLLDNTAAQKYTFQLIFNPPQYETYLRTILEDEATFFKQKNRFFDHLLSRFSEDFTDYTLLTFATLRNNGQQINTADSLPMNRRFALDKTRFLQNYPDISRNRAKALDYSKPTWDDTNQSGLENRVSKLIGIAERRTKTLNYFDILERPTRYRFRILDAHNRPLLVSSLTFENPADANIAANICCHNGRIPHRFEATNCVVEHVFGFRLLDAETCPIAESADTFGSVVLRDRKMRYAQGVLAGDGVMREFRADTEGVFFKIKDNLSGQLRAQIGATDEQAALRPLVACLELLSKQSNWKTIDEPSKRGFGFQIVDNQNIIAIYSEFFRTKTERDNRLNDTFFYFKTKEKLWQTQQHTPRYRWQILGTDNKPLLTARHFFSTPEQAAAAFGDAKRAILNADFGQLTTEDFPEKNQFDLVLWQFNTVEKGNLTQTRVSERAGDDADNLELAKTSFSRIGERDAAVYAIQLMAHALDVGTVDATNTDFWQYQTTENGSARLDTEGGKWALSLTTDDMPDGEGLFGQPIFEDVTAALAATLTVVPTDTEGLAKIINVAELGENYTFFTENKGCIISFELKNEEMTLATYTPFQLLVQTAEQKRDAIVRKAQKNVWDIELQKVINERWFEVLDETCDEQLTAVLRGRKLQTDEAGIRADFDDFIKNIKSDALQIKATETAAQQFVFEFVGSFEPFEKRGTSVAFFATAEAALAAGERLLLFLKTDFSTKIETFAVENDPNECAENDWLPNTNRWRLSDADDRVARYVGRVFKDTETVEATTVLEDLVLQNVCKPPVFSMVFENTGNFGHHKPDVLRQQKRKNKHVQNANIGRDTRDYYYFILRDARHLYWRSSAIFDSADEALAAFETQHITVLTLARDVSNYKIRSLKVAGQAVWGFELCYKNGQSVAESIELVADTEGVTNLLVRLHEHALLFPIVKNDDNSFRFQVYDLKKQGEEWQSRRTYTTQKEATTAFRRFLDLLKYRGNFRLIPTADACRQYIELVEVLLDEVTAQKFKKNATDDTTDCDWLGVEAFVDDLVLLGETAFVPTVDYLNCCGYGFKLATSDYRLARYARSFHAYSDREQERDTLWQTYRCGKTAAVTEGAKIGKIMDYITRGFFKENEKDCSKGLSNTLIFKELTLQDGVSTATENANDVYAYPDIFNDSDEVKNFKTRRAEAVMEAKRLMPNLGSWLVLTDFDGSMRLGIRRADGSLVLVFEEWATTETAEMANEIALLYEGINFSSPIVAFPDGRFGFEIREKTNATQKVFVNGFMTEDCASIPVDLPVFRLIWQSVSSFATIAEASETVEIVKNLLKNKANYARTEAADGSPTLEIVDATKIIAQHPRTYTTPAERDAAWQKVKQHIHTEGMHLVEHLLLRPRDKVNLADKTVVLDANKMLLPVYISQDEADKTLQKAAAAAFNPFDDDADFNDYLMDADPYSFVVTVVLPHWSARFRDLDFRDFFENMLRREALAHVALNILWVNPVQMQAFERVWRPWLEVATDSTHHLYACRKECLITVLSNLKSITPDAMLLDCKAGVQGSLIVLDKTTLR